jgi:HSP20 family protein
MDLCENGKENTVTASFDLPGFSKESVDIDVHNGRLTISAERKMLGEHENEQFAIRERPTGKFGRTLQLPEGVQASFQ